VTVHEGDVSTLTGVVFLSAVSVCRVCWKHTQRSCPSGSVIYVACASREVKSMTGCDVVVMYVADNGDKHGETDASEPIESKGQLYVRC